MSSSSKRLAMVVAAGHHATATASDPNNNQMSLRSNHMHRNTQVNLILASMFLGSVLMVSCMCMCMNYCIKTKMRRRYTTDHSKMLHISPESPTIDSSVYTLQGDCPHRVQYCEASELPPYRRPPTPGPPPAYESVVSKDSKFRKFGDNDSDEGEKFTSDNNSETKLYNLTEQESAMSRLDKLRQCRIEGNCSIYNTDTGIDNNDIKLSVDDKMKANGKKYNRDCIECEDTTQEACDAGDTIERQQLDSEMQDPKDNSIQDNNDSIQEGHYSKFVVDLVNKNDDGILEASTPLLMDETPSSNTSTSAVDESQTSAIVPLQNGNNSNDQMLPSYEDALIMVSKISK